MSSKVCVIAGVGPGNGMAFSQKFAAKGYRVAMLARSRERLAAYETQVANSTGYAVDLTDPRMVQRAFTQIRADLGTVDVLVHNAGSLLAQQFIDTDLEDFEEQWRRNTFSFILCAREAVADMREAGAGTVIVIGATASVRGGSNFAAFASSKAAQRSLAQSMARSLGPRNIHVAHVIVDGVIDTPRTRQFLPDEPDEFFLKSEHIAEAVYALSQQNRSAWTFEIDLRPFGEAW